MSFSASSALAETSSVYPRVPVWDILLCSITLRGDLVESGLKLFESRHDRLGHSLLDPVRGSLLRLQVKVHVVDDVVRRFGNSISLTWNLGFCARSHSTFSSFTVVSSTFTS